MKRRSGQEVIKRKRRRRAVHNFSDRYGKMILVIACGLIGLWAAIAIFAGDAKEQRREQKEEANAQIAVTQEPAVQMQRTIQDPDNSLPPFNRMSADWGTDDVKDFTFYSIPADFKNSQGRFPEVVQVYVHCICRGKDIDPDIITAMVETESGYRYDAQSGCAYGYMQIVPEFHTERMERLNVTDLLDPYQNLRTGIDYLAELLEKYDGSYSKALTAYNYGPAGAYRNFFSAGEERSAYSDKVLQIADRIKREKQEG